ncbi:MAG: hemolysin III family protein [Clostridiales bacterium]|nr:hemolysin III family protein [Clostridiales bacterium]
MKINQNSVRALPTYTKKEELFNSWSHLLCLPLCLALFVVCIVIAARYGGGFRIASAVLYGLCTIGLYLASGLYHGAVTPRIKRILQTVDHCTVYFMIAGTYTPFLFALYCSAPQTAYILLGIEWGVALIAAALTAIDIHKFRIFSKICYGCLTWLVLIAIPQTVASMPPAGSALLFAGSTAYSVGILFFAFGIKKRHMHNVFHIFIILGTVLHAVGIVGYALRVS